MAVVATHPWLLDGKWMARWEGYSPRERTRVCRRRERVAGEASTLLLLLLLVLGVQLPSSSLLLRRSTLQLGRWRRLHNNPPSMVTTRREDHMSGLAFSPLTTAATWGEGQVSLCLSPATITTSYRGASGLVSSLSMTRKSPSVSGSDHHKLRGAFSLVSSLLTTRKSLSLLDIRLPYARLPSKTSKYVYYMCVCVCGFSSATSASSWSQSCQEQHLKLARWFSLKK